MFSVFSVFEEAEGVGEAETPKEGDSVFSGSGVRLAAAVYEGTEENDGAAEGAVPVK